MQKAGIRFKTINQNMDFIQVGREKDTVYAFKFRNNGTHALLKVQKGGEGFELRPGEEESFGLEVGTNVYFMETFNITWEAENQNPLDSEGNQTAIAPEDSVFRGVLTEMYLKYE